PLVNVHIPTLPKSRPDHRGPRPFPTRRSSDLARALLGQPDPEALAQAIVAQGLSVRQAEAVVQERASQAGKSPTRRPRGEKDTEDRKSTRLNSSHEWISYAVFCLKKKTTV